MDTIAQTTQTNTQTEQTTPATTVATATNTTQTLSWFTSRNTVIGGLIFAAFGTVVYYVQSIINRKEHEANKKVDNRAAISMIDYRNQAQLDFLKKKYQLQAEYSSKMEPPVREEGEFSVHTPSDYLDKEYDLHPMVGFLLPENFDGILYGMKNTLKSYTAMGTLIQLALGEKPRILSPKENESYTTPENVYCIYADGENGGTVYKDRYHALGNRLDGKLEIIQSDTFGDDIDGFMNCIKNRCLLRPAGTKIVLCVDNIKSLFNDLSQSAGRRFLNELKKLRSSLRQYGISLTTLTVCHTEKSGDKLYGSYNTQCLAPVVLKLTEGDDYNHINLTLENTRTDLKGQTRSLAVRVLDYKFLEYEEPDEGEKGAIISKKDTPKQDGRGSRWTDEDTERLRELASTLETPDKEHIASKMGRTPNMIYKMARLNGIELMSKPRGRKPKENSES